MDPRLARPGPSLNQGRSELPQRSSAGRPAGVQPLLVPVLAAALTGVLVIMLLLAGRTSGEGKGSADVSSASATATALSSAATLTAPAAWANLLPELDGLWNRGEWSPVVDRLEAYQARFGASDESTAKLYVAHLNLARTRLDEGNRPGAVAPLQTAQALRPSQPVATATLAALTPTVLTIPSRAP